MTRQIKPASHADVRMVKRALEDLRRARNALTHTGCRSAAAKVRKAMKSCEGAVRHVERRVMAYKEYLVSVDYRTATSAGTRRLHVIATSEDHAVDLATARVRKLRYVTTIDGGSCELVQQ